VQKNFPASHFLPRRQSAREATNIHGSSTTGWDRELCPSYSDLLRFDRLCLPG
jgi:hypothetical protein